MGFIVMRYYSLAKLIIFIPFCSQAKPPLDVDSFITQQGDGRFYANGRMQTIINVNYILEKGDAIESIELREQYTNASLEDIGLEWTYDENEYEHEILTGGKSSESRTNDSLPNYLREEGQVKFYISSEQPGSRNICFDIQTENGGHRNTCNNDEYQDSVALTALFPLVYGGKDMQTIAIGDTYTDTGLIIWAYGVYNKTNPTLRYLHYSGVLESPQNLVINTEDFATRDIYKQCELHGCVNYVGGYITTPEVNTLSFIEGAEPYRRKEFDFTPTDRPIVTVVPIVGTLTLVAGDYVCESGPWAPEYQCGKYTEAGMGSMLVPPGEIDPFLSTVQSHEITVTDMYGTDHQLRFLSDTVRYIGIALEGVEDTQATPPLPLEF